MRSSRGGRGPDRRLSIPVIHRANTMNAHSKTGETRFTSAVTRSLVKNSLALSAPFGRGSVSYGKHASEPRPQEAVFRVSQQAHGIRTGPAGFPAAFFLALALPAQTVDVVKIVAKKAEHKLDLPGEILPYQSVAVRAKVTGFVDQVNVDRGSVVKEGDVLATLV